MSFATQKPTCESLRAYLAAPWSPILRGSVPPRLIGSVSRAMSAVTPFNAPSAMPKVLNRYHLDGKMPPNAKYVGRGTVWGNPYRIGAPGVPDRDTAVDLYEDYFYGLHGGLLRQQARLHLTGKDLVCFCAPKRCHADVILDFLEGRGRIQP